MTMGMNEHTFRFHAGEIAKAAGDEAAYHEARADYWQGEYERAVERVEDTIGAKVNRRPVTGGFEVEVVIDYGDQEAYGRMQQAFRKMNTHREKARLFRTDETLYGTQDRDYELSNSDVHALRIGAPERDLNADEKEVEYA